MLRTACYACEDGVADAPLGALRAFDSTCLPGIITCTQPGLLIRGAGTAARGPFPLVSLTISAALPTRRSRRWRRRECPSTATASSEGRPWTPLDWQAAGRTGRPATPHRLLLPVPACHASQQPTCPASFQPRFPLAGCSCCPPAPAPLWAWATLAVTPVTAVPGSAAASGTAARPWWDTSPAACAEVHARQQLLCWDRQRKPAGVPVALRSAGGTRCLKVTRPNRLCTRTRCTRLGTTTF